MRLKLNEKLEVLYFQLIAVAPGPSFTLYLIEITMAALKVTQLPAGLYKRFALQVKLLFTHLVLSMLLITQILSYLLKLDLKESKSCICKYLFLVKLEMKYSSALSFTEDLNVCTLLIFKSSVLYCSHSAPLKIQQSLTLRLILLEWSCSQCEIVNLCSENGSELHFSSLSKKVGGGRTVRHRCQTCALTNNKAMFISMFYFSNVYFNDVEILLFSGQKCSSWLGVWGFCLVLCCCLQNSQMLLVSNLFLFFTFFPFPLLVQIKQMMGRR